MAMLLAKASTQYVDMGANTPAGQNVAGITVSAWVKMTSLDATERYVFSASTNADASFSRVSITLTATTNLFRAAFRRLDADAVQAVSGGTAATTGTLYHVAVVGDYIAGTVRLYLNGVQDASITGIAGWGANSQNTASLRAAIGVRGNIVQPWDGVVDDVRLYHRALSALEIENIYGSRGRDNVLYGLYSRWKMIEANSGATASGTTGAIKDTAANLHSTAVNSPVYASSLVGTRARRTT